jgi:NAD(P)-dependent dehydrogenase (short-subunit alcohol dehydrogenase family)
VEIQGTTVLVTGANGGIGGPIAQALASHAASVLAGVRSIDQHHVVLALPRVRAVRVDLSSQRSIEESVRAIETSEIDVLINNAGVVRRSPSPSIGSMNSCSPRSLVRST